MKVTEKGLEIATGISIPWEWADGIVCGIIEKGNAELLTKPAVEFIDGALQKIVDKTTFKFDDVGKVKLLKALAKTMVEKYAPELLVCPPPSQ